MDLPRRLGTLALGGIALLLISGCAIFADPPTANFAASPKLGTAPLTVNFDATSSVGSGSALVSYEWDFGDGRSGSGRTVSHTYRDMGTYTARLSVSDERGLTGTAKEDISVAGTVAYDDLFRHNERYIGDSVYFRGEIIQVTSKFFGGVVWRVATKKLEFVGYIEDVVWVNYNGPRYLEGDVVDLIGEVKGLKSYIAVLGNEVTVPELDALRVDLVRKAGE